MLACKDCLRRCSGASALADQSPLRMPLTCAGQTRGLSNTHADVSGKLKLSELVYRTGGGTSPRYVKRFVRIDGSL